MLLVLTCALCTLQTPPATTAPRAGLLAERLSLADPPSLASPSPVPLAAAPSPLHVPLPGSGDGSDHSDHMTTMWIVMGAMMVVMMVGMGVYLSQNHHYAAAAPPAAAPGSPALRALPVVAPSGG